MLIQTPAYVRALREKVRDAVRVLFPGPSLIVAGRHDGSVDYRDAWRLAGKLPRSTYAVIDRAEHGLPIDQRDLFAALVRDWLASVEEASMAS